MQIRLAELGQVQDIVEIYDKAREFMRKTGNMHQWTDGYPNETTLLRDIALGQSYICVEGGRIVATFFFSEEEEPTYRIIEGGCWLNEDRYGVIHRVASDGSVKGIMAKILDFCFAKIPNIRIDTHRDNKVMQQCLLRYGFGYRGIIYLANGDERLAYQLCMH